MAHEPAAETTAAGPADDDGLTAVAGIVFLCVIGAVPMLLVGPAAEVAALIHTPPSTVPNPVGARPSSAPTTGHAGESRHAKAD